MNRRCIKYPLALLSLLLLFVYRGRAQTISARQGQVDELNRRAKQYYQRNFTTAEKLCTEAFSLADVISYEVGAATALGLQSLIYANTNRTEEALNQLQQAIAQKRFQEAIQTREILLNALSICWLQKGQYDSAAACSDRFHALNNTLIRTNLQARQALTTARIHIKRGRQQKAMQFYHAALAVFKKEQDEEGMAAAEDVLGEIYYAQRLFQNAKAAFRQSLQSFEKRNNHVGSIMALLHMGNTFYLESADDSAGKCYLKALQLCDSLGDTNGSVICYSNLSRLALDAGQTSKALNYAETALSLIAPGNYQTIEASNYQQIGDIYAEMGQWKKAIAYVQKALAAARQADHKTIIKDCYKSLSEIYEAMHRPEEALHYLLAAYRLKDTLQPIHFNQQLAELEAKYETEQKDDEIKLLQQQKEINLLKLEQQQQTLSRQKILLLLACMIILAGSGFAYLYITRRRLKEQLRRREIIQQTEELERIRIAKDIHDELGSGLSRIRFLSHQAENSSNEGVQRIALHSISESSQEILSNMRDLIWAMNPDNATLDSLAARIREYAADYLEELPINIHFGIPDIIPERKISTEFSRNVFMIVKELLQNVVKHAAANELNLQLHIDHELLLVLQDNGLGFAPEEGRLKGNGIRNMKTRSQALNGSLEIHSEPGQGTTITLRCPIPYLT